MVRNKKSQKPKILEVGCGPQNRWIKESQNKDYDYSGIDLRDFGQKYVGDFMTYDFGKDKFNVIVMHHLVEHIPDTVALFNKLGEVLKPDGTVDIRVPQLPYEYAYVDPTHVKFIPGVRFFQYFTKESPAGHCYSEKEFDVIDYGNDRYEWELHVVMRLV